jgi:hypothetical protein
MRVPADEERRGPCSTSRPTPPSARAAGYPWTAVQERGEHVLDAPRPGGDEALIVAPLVGVEAGVTAIAEVYLGPRIPASGEPSVPSTLDWRLAAIVCWET